MRSVSFSEVGRVIVTWYSAIERILFSWGCVVKFQAREANSWRRSASSNPGNWVCVLFPFLSFFLSLFLFFSFFPPTFSIFSRSNTLTQQRSCLPKIPLSDLIWRGTKSSLRTSWGRLVANLTREVRTDAERPKGDRYLAICFTRFVNYRLMFDSGRSFSLEYDLIRSPHSGAHNPPAVLKIPRIVASPTSLSASVLHPLALR